MRIKTLKTEYSNLENSPAVYIFTNLVNGKFYIGESVNLKRRMEEYFYPHKRENRIIHKAINKYGIDNFTFEFYYFPSFTKDDLLKLEEQMIISYNSIIPNGYNICPKGTNCVGIKLSDETRSKMRMSRMREVHKYDALSGNYLETYPSVELAAINVSGNGPNISLCSSGKRKTAHGFTWSYDKVEQVTPVKNVGITLPKIIQKKSRDGNIVGEFLTLKDAANSVNGHGAHICNACNGKAKSAYGHFWSYK